MKKEQIINIVGKYCDNMQKIAWSNYVEDMSLLAEDNVNRAKPEDVARITINTTIRASATVLAGVLVELFAEND